MRAREVIAVASAQLWSPAGLTARVQRLREEYFSFYTRDYFRNQVMAFTTGKPWDVVFSPHNWGVVPEMFVFFPSYTDSLLASAVRVTLPEDFWKHGLPLRRAIFFSRVLEEHLPVQILDGELIVGGQFNTALSRCFTAPEAAAWREREERYLRALFDLHYAGLGNAGAIPGHLIPNYRRVLRVGLAGLVDEVEREMAREADPARREFLRSLVVAAAGARHLALRYSREALRLAEQAADRGDDRRREELEAIARACARVPWEPPHTFAEALQALWFTHMLIMAQESYPGAGLSYGRVDQYLYPFYRRDLEEGRLSREEAKELLGCWWIKHNYVYDYQGRVGANQGINSGFGQLITLGGMGPDGSDASNELTELMLEVIGDINLLEPKPNIRLHAGTPDHLLEKVVGLIARAQGAPFLLNFDEKAMAGLRWQGLPEEELWDYAPVGCLENTLQGKDRSGTVDANVNLAKAVELALNDGRIMAAGEDPSDPGASRRLLSRQWGPHTGDPRTFSDFDRFLASVKAQLEALVRHVVELACQADAIRAAFEPTPFLSLLVDGCVRQRRDITAGGAEHNYITLEGVGLATLVDSVVGVHHAVYQERRASMEELLAALGADFEGHERLESFLRNRAPKFGNGDPAVDRLAADLSRHWTSYAFGMRSPATGRRFRGGYLSWNYWIGYGPLTAATPDGRRRGRPLSNGVCPVNGCDRSGPTAVVRSVGALGLETAPNGASHTMSFSSATFRDPEHIRKFAAFLRAYGELGGTALQVNVIDAETLRDAQRHPEEYANLLVRVTGYNAYFVHLGKEIQDEIIARESHRA